MAAKKEPFPDLSSREKLKPLNGNGNQTRPRRKSSGLGGELPGDTGAPAVATLDMTSPSLSALKAQAEEDRKKPYSKRRKAKTFLQRVKHYSLKRTWVPPLVILFIFLALYLINPTESNPIHKFIFLSYEEPAAPGTPPNAIPNYGKGLWDFAFVAFYTVVLSFTREFIMQTILRPLSRHAGLKSRTKQARFMEQMYTAIYFGFLGPIGVWVMSRSPIWFFNTRGMYEDYPHRILQGEFKFYYLFQAAYWAQQMIVLCLGMEKPRKDFKELVAHHIVSLALIFLSYRFHFTHMGLPVYITHDISDFFLATSKTLNYLDHFLVGPYFAFFVFVWIYLRHYINIRIILSIFTEFRTVGPYGVVWETESYKGPEAFIITGSLLSALQALNLFWLFFILRIAYRYVFFNVAEDDRSEDEGEEEEELLDQDQNGPDLLVNGEPLTDKATGVDVKTDGLTKRKTKS